MQWILQYFVRSCIQMEFEPEPCGQVSHDPRHDLLFFDYTTEVVVSLGESLKGHVGYFRPKKLRDPTGAPKIPQTFYFSVFGTFFHTFRPLVDQYHFLLLNRFFLVRCLPVSYKHLSHNKFERKIKIIFRPCDPYNLRIWFTFVLDGDVSGIIYLNLCGMNEEKINWRRSGQVRQVQAS